VCRYTANATSGRCRRWSRTLPSASAGSGLRADETLQGVFAWTYDRVAVDHPGGLRDLVGGTTTVDGLRAPTKTYELPSGEPYDRYWDVWWESAGRLFVLAGWTYAEHADEILTDFESVRDRAEMLHERRAARATRPGRRRRAQAPAQTRRAPRAHREARRRRR
jgi:hypothetical protein